MKINGNKGFAVTALLYGLSIMGFMTVVLMMSIMQNSRKNNTTTVRTVEQELNNYGSTATNYTGTGEDLNKTIPNDQTGYYKLELCNKKAGVTTGTMITGTVYLPGGTDLKISIGETSSISIGDNQIMIVTDTMESINGMAKYVTTPSDQKKYPILNGQVIKQATCTSGFKMNKVSSNAPQALSSAFDIGGSATSIVTKTEASRIIVTYYKELSTEAAGVTTCNNTTSCNLNLNSKISDIYIEYATAPTSDNMEVKIGTNIISPDKPGYAANEKGFSFSRFEPISSQPIPNGNYAISLVSDTSNKINISSNKKNVLSTSVYTPSPGPGLTMCQVANSIGTTDLIHYGSDSLARPVLVSKYASLNRQKWRFEYLASESDATKHKYKITEIEEYKPFEVHKNDTSLGTNGPILVCGEYVCTIDTVNPSSEEFKSTDSYRNNPNQKWVLTPTGMGTYRFQANDGIGLNQFLQYDSTSKKFYVTNTESSASLFYIHNVIL